MAWMAKTAPAVEFAATAEACVNQALFPGSGGAKALRYVKHLSYGQNLVHGEGTLLK